MDLNRRIFLQKTCRQSAILGLGGVLGQTLPSQAWANAPATSPSPSPSASPLLTATSLKGIGPLGEPDANGVRLPKGFTSRIVAKSGSPVTLADGKASAYHWHKNPDGGACFKTEDGGWIYTSNSESTSVGEGGAGALRFDAAGQVIGAYSILQKTSHNCAGGPTPWNTWLSCEEIEGGQVFECDVTGKTPAKPCPGLGLFTHEAVALDPQRGHAYLTEDRPDGLLYRYTPARIGKDGVFDFTEGRLEVAVVAPSGQVTWSPVPQPMPGRGDTPTRKQVANATRFSGGEGIWYHQGEVYFTTKGDNRVWTYDTAKGTLRLLYDRRTAKEPILAGVDNVTVTKDGHVLVAEDGDDMQLVILGPHGEIYPILQVVGHDDSEITGPAINHLGNRLYFSSQRGTGGLLARSVGVTFEISGHFA